MNKINPRASAFVGTAHRIQGRHRGHRARMIVVCAVAPIAAMLAPAARASVQLTSVASGSASVSERGAVTTIRTSNNAILNFSHFDIAAGSTVNFAQPSAASRVLDRVNSATPSQINGSLISNGTVYLVNPAGVIFGSGAVVDVNRFYAAASQLSNQDFLAGADHFSGVSGMVSNSGQIRANQVSLIGSQVINQGSIVAVNGLVAMVAGSDVYLSQQGSHVSAKVLPQNAPTPAASGTLGSAQGSLMSSPMAAGDVYALAIRHTGTIQASNVLINGGQGKVEVSGSIDASTNTAGATGGTVAVTGGQVELASANINVSGPGGGGTVQIGGGVHGSGDLSHAQSVSADSGTSIDANATSDGSGGTISLWSDGTTTTSSTLTARGGPVGGNGGFIETSGEFLQVSGVAPNASAPHGNAGTWLMDPINITIANGTGSGTFTGPTVFNADINTALDAGTNVVVDTSNQTNGADVGTLVQNADAPITVASAANPVSLILRANSDMTLNGGITATGTSALSVELDQLNSGASAVAINAAININGNLNIVGGNVTLASGIGLTAASATLGSGTVVADSGSIGVSLGTVSLTGPVVTTGDFVSGGTSFSTSGTGTINSNGGNVTITATGADSIGAAVNTGTGSFSATGATGFTSTAAGVITTTGGNVTVGSSGADLFQGAVHTGGGAVAVTGTSFENDDVITDDGVATGSNPMAINTSAGTGTLNINGAITWSGGTGRDVVIEGGGNVVITATTGSITSSAGALPVSLYTTGNGNTVTINGSVNTANGAFASDGGLFTLGTTGTLTSLTAAINNVATAANGDSKAVINGTVSITNAVVTHGAFTSGGTAFTSSGTGTVTTNGGNVSITSTGVDTIGAAVNSGAGTFSAVGGTAFSSTASITTADATVTISSSGPDAVGAAIVTGGGALAVNGGTTFNSAVGGTITTAGGSVSILTTGVDTIGAAVSTGVGDFAATGASAFNNSAGGTITTTGGNVIIGTTGGDLIQGVVNTNGGAFTATGSSFENDAAISDGGVGTGTNALSINTSSGAGTININGALTWTGGAGRDMVIEGGGAVTTTAATGLITSTGATALPVSIFTIGAASNVTINAAVNISGLFTSGGGNFTLANFATSPAVALTAGSLTLNTATTTPDAKPVTEGTVSIAGSVVTHGAVAIGGATSFFDNQGGTITTNGGAVTVTNPGLISIGQAITTGGGAFTALGNSSFTAAASGTITTGGGNVSISSAGGDAAVTLQSAVNTGGGSFSAVGTSFENDAAISDGGVATSTNSLEINTTSGTGGVTSTGNITINGPITWSGGTGRQVLLDASGNITINAAPAGITATDTNPLIVEMFTTGSASTATEMINGAVNTTGQFTAAGGLFTVAATGALTAQAVSIGTATLSPDSNPVSSGTITISGPINSTTGNVLLGGTVSLIDNQNGAITTQGGAVTISNTGIIALGSAISTSGGAFSALGNSSFTAASNATITTGGGNVALSSAGGDAAVTLQAAVNTGGGGFSAVGTSFENDAAITDGGVASSGGAFSINTTSGTGVTGSTGIATINGPITWAGGTGRSVLIVGGGAVTFSAAATITSSGPTPLPVSTFTTSTVVTDGVTINSAVVTSGAFISAGGVFNLTSTGTLTAQTVSINLATTAPISGSPAVTNQSVLTSGAIVSTGDVLIGGNTQYIETGPITTSGGQVNITNTGIIGLGNPISTSGGAFSATGSNTFATSASGTITTGGGTVTIICSGDITIGPTVTSGGSAINTGGGDFIVTGGSFTNTAPISDGGVNDSKPAGVEITATNGNIVLNGDIDWAASLSPITFVVLQPNPSVPNNLQIGANLIANPAEPINLTSVPVAVNANPGTISGGNITIGSIINGVGGGGTVGLLTIQSTGIVSLGAVGAADNPVGSVTITNFQASAPPAITLNGNIFTTGNTIFSGAVTLPANVSIDATGTSGDLIEFDHTVDGPGGLSISLPGISGNGDSIRFNDNLGVTTPLAFLDLSPGLAGLTFFRAGTDPNSFPGVTSPQPATTVNIASGGNIEINDTNPTPRDFSEIFATIDSYGPLTINIGTSGSPNAANQFVMGQNEKLSVYGDLTINTNGGTAAVGDLSSIGNMTLSASTVIFHLRFPTLIGSTPIDSGVDLIAGGVMTLPAGATFIADKSQSPSGAFDVPGFIASSFSASSNISQLSSQMKTAFSVVPGIPASVLFGPSNLLLDLTPSTISGKVPDFIPPIPFVYDLAIAGAVPRDQLVAGTVPRDFKIAMQPVLPGPVVEQDLKDSGIFTRDASLEEILAATDSVAVYNDMPQKRRPRPQDFSVATNRLDSKRVREFLADYRAVFFSAGENSGEPINRRAEIAADIQLAWDAYVYQNAYKQATGAGFQKYCFSTQSASKASTELAQLYGLKTQLNALGLSGKEASVAFEGNILGDLYANGMREGDLNAAVDAVGSGE